jgi:HlyD family secretion protein
MMRRGRRGGGPDWACFRAGNEVNGRMKISRAVLAGFVALAALLTSCGEQEHHDGVYQGYLEGRFLGVASPQEGQLVDLKVRRGQWVEAGAPLFALDPQPETDELQEEEGNVQSAQAKVDDLRKGLRDTEIAALEDQLKADRAVLEQANLERERNEPLLANQYVSTNDYDRMRLLVDQDAAVAQRDENQLATGKLGARDDQIREAAADLAAAEAVRDHTKWMLDQKTQCAPQASYVQDTLYRVGERVEPGQAVVVLLPPAEMTARFFVPEPEINRVQLGQTVTVTLDGLAPFKAKVSYISTQVEFTPPVIYSREQNFKYVFMVEADIDSARARDLHVGQPAEVSINP